MTIKRIIVTALSAGVLIALWANGGEEIGDHVNMVNGDVSVGAGSSPIVLGTAVVVLIAYLIALDPDPAERAGPVAGQWRRGVAWFLDFLLSLFALSSVLALLPLTWEALRTGHFQWAFERNFVMTADWVLSLTTVGLVFIGMAVYWAIPIVTRGQTIAQAIFGIKAVSTTDAQPRLLWCLVRGLIQPFAVFAWFGHFFTPDHSYPHDTIAGVRVVVVRATSRAA